MIISGEDFSSPSSMNRFLNKEGKFPTDSYYDRDQSSSPKDPRVSYNGVIGSIT